MRIIVTGAAGFIGKHVVRTLLTEGYNIVAVDKDIRGLEEFSMNKKCLIHRINILDGDFKGVIEIGDKVLHLAAVSRFHVAKANPALAVRVNVEGTLNVIKACIEKNADRLVYSSTGSVYSLKAPVPVKEDALREPRTIYGLTKKMAEDTIIFHGKQLPYVILRYGYVFGAGKDWGAVGAFIKRLSNNEQPVVFGGNQTNDFIYIKDLVEANRLALETQFTNQAYNIGSGRAVSIRDVCDFCIKAVGSNLKTKIEPARSFERLVFVYDILKATTLLRFQPKWNVLDGVKDMVKSL